MNRNKKVALIGYSGHAFVVVDIFASSNIDVKAYCELIEKKTNPYNLEYLGAEQEIEVLKKLRDYNYFIAIGENVLRSKVYNFLSNELGEPENAIHASAIISGSAKLGSGIMIGPGSIINAQSIIENGAICNTGCIIEHECIIGSFAHVAPGAVLGGNVEVGKHSFIGAGASVKHGIKIGNNVIIGAGAVVIINIPDNSKVVGNPQRFI